jgi:heptosyltransferase-2
MTAPARILVRATNWIGDAVMSLPALRAVRTQFPSAHIAVLARPWVADLYFGEAAVDRVIPYPHRSGVHDLAAKWRTAQTLRRERFDLAILFQNAFESAAIARLAGIPRILGYNRDGRGFLLSQAVPVPLPGEIPTHELYYYLELLRRGDIISDTALPEPVLPEPATIRLEGAAAAAARGREALAGLHIPEPFIGVSPGAAYGSAKQWLPERFAESVARLAFEQPSDGGASICLFGSPTEVTLCDAVARMIGEIHPNLYVRNLAGQTSLRTFIDLAAAATLFLTNDSGAMHIASALGTPTVTVFGATNHLTTGPTGPCARVVRENVSCSPCLLRECPIDHRCMTGVSAARVIEAAAELIAMHASHR